MTRLVHCSTVICKPSSFALQRGCPPPRRLMCVPSQLLVLPAIAWSAVCTVDEAVCGHGFAYLKIPKTKIVISIFSF